MTEKRKVTVDGEDFEVEIRPGEGNWEVSIEGRTYTVEIEGLERKKQRKRSAAKTSSTTVSGIISSAIPGKIVAIMAAEGDGKDLGHMLEFKSEVQLSLDLSKNSELGFSYNHISNASLGDKNPGANSYMFNFLKNF